MENVKRGWQATTKKIRNRLQHVLDFPAEFLPDVHFQVGFPEGKQEKIGAHKLILAAGSEVLYAMLLGLVAEKMPCVRIPDLHPKAFRQMLKFLYTDEIEQCKGLESEEAWLAFRTMECARKYDIPELYFVCRSVIVRLLGDHEECRCQVYDKILIEAFAIGDVGLVDMAYYAMLGLPGSCSLAEINLEAVPRDLLCYLLERNETTLCEEEVYSLCLGWAETQYDGEASPKELKKVLGKARYLVRYSEMEPSAIADGPCRDGILSSDELKLVFQKKFGSLTIDYPFSEGERQLYQSRPAVRLPVKANYEFQQSSFISFVLEIQFRAELPLDFCDKFSSLRDLNYPFELWVENKNLSWKKPSPDISDEQKKLAKSLFTKPAATGAHYVMAGDVAVANTGDDRLELHLALKPSFKPAEWIVLGPVADKAQLELFKCVLDMSKIHDDDDDDDDEIRGPVHVSVYKR